MADRRPKPLLFATWASRILVGANHCNWAVWHRTHYFFNKTTFDGTKDLIKHTAIKRRVEKVLMEKGYDVIYEVWWSIEGERLDFNGRCDIVAIKGDRGVIVEVKGGNPYDSDRAQLLIYMWGLPKSEGNRFKGIMFDGLLAYEDHEIAVSAVEVDENFTTILKTYIIDVLENEPLKKFPSFFECKYCNIADCDERQTEPDLPPEKSDYKPDFF